MSEKQETYNPDIYTLIDENNQEQAFELLDVFETDDQRYLAFIPYFENPEDSLDDDGDLVILKAVEENGEEMLASIDDDDEYDRIGKIFLKRISDMFDEYSE